jgi:hypothetical protein
MSYRIVYWLVSMVVYLGCFWAMFEWVAEAQWVIVPIVLVLLFTPREWLAEKISGQPRVDPFGRSERKEPESRPSMDQHSGEHRPGIDRYK